MPYTLPPIAKVASFDVDPQNTFTPTCPNELPVPNGNQIARELNAQAQFASLRVASRDAHCLQAVWIATEDHPQFSKIANQPNADIYWKPHAIVGTKGFEYIDGLDPQVYDFQVYKGIDPSMHPYGACYHDLAEKKTTGIIEFLRFHGIETVIVGGLATDYCVKNTVLQLCRSRFNVVVNLGACCGIATDTTEQAIEIMQINGAIIVQNSSTLTNADC